GRLSGNRGLRPVSDRPRHRHRAHLRRLRERRRPPARGARRAADHRHPRLRALRAAGHLRHRPRLRLRL
ncbi:MAG: ATP synthase F0 sector subunit c, partial [uncultured Quadrisphaera sp.]